MSEGHSSNQSGIDGEEDRERSLADTNEQRPQGSVFKGGGNSSGERQPVTRCGEIDGGQEELGHTDIMLTAELQSASSPQGSRKIASKGAIIVSDTDSSRPCSREQGLAGEEAGCDGEELEYAEHDGLLADEESESLEETSDGTEEGQDATSDIEGTSRPCSLRDLWPSRPGESQGIWEPPRVTCGKTNISHSKKSGQLRTEESENEGEDSGYGRGPDASNLCGSDRKEENGKENVGDTDTERQTKCPHERRPRCEEGIVEGTSSGGTSEGQENELSPTTEGQVVVDATSKRNNRIRGNSEEADGTPEEGRSSDWGNGELDRPSKEGTVAHPDSRSDGNGRTLGSSNRQGRKSAKSRTSGIQQERKIDGDRPQPASGNIGAVICGSCGFKNATKWKRTKCLVCGKELAYT